MLPHLRHLPPAARTGLGYLIGDIGFARFSALLEREPDYPHRVAYFAGGASCNWVLWQVSSVVGILAATAIPIEWGLALAGTLVLIPLLLPFCRDRPALAGVCVASVIAVVGHDWPLRLGLVAAIVAGMSTALTVERLLPRQGST
jgi:predicted branched-subunit amino acid permease